MHERYDEECIFPYLLDSKPYIFYAQQQKEDWDEGKASSKHRIK
jgi:hypothetical protein